MVTLDQVRALFEGFLQGDVGVQRQIDTGPAEVFVENGQLVFTLAALLQLLDSKGDMDLNAFKQLLYTSELNRELGLKGVEVAIHTSTGKTDSNRYCLKAT